MRIAYIYDLPATVADDWGCEKVFVDVPKARRSARTDLLDRGGLRAGDVLVICKKSQLGQGQESAAMQRRIAEIGATIEVIELPPRQSKKRGGWLVPTDEQKLRICPLWRSTQPASYVIERASDIMGAEVDRNWLNRHCDPRGRKTKD